MAKRPVYNEAWVKAMQVNNTSFRPQSPLVKAGVLTETQQEAIYQDYDKLEQDIIAKKIEDEANMVRLRSKLSSLASQFEQYKASTERGYTQEMEMARKGIFLDYSTRPPTTKFYTMIPTELAMAAGEHTMAEALEYMHVGLMLGGLTPAVDHH